MRRRAHRPHVAGRRQVAAMAGYGLPEADIACVLDIDPETLRKHYRRELETGHIKASARVAENLYRKATGEGREAVTAAIFWLKDAGRLARDGSPATHRPDHHQRARRRGAGRVGGLRGARIGSWMRTA